jgi:PAP2 superfamily protein
MLQGNRTRKVSTAAVLVAAAIVAASEARADAVTDWNVIALRAHAAAGLLAVPRTRVLAIMHVAVHDAVNAIDRRAEPYAFDMRAVASASPEAAVAAAAYTVLSALVPSQQTALNAAYADSLRAVADGPAKDRGVAVGALAAQHILWLRQNDGSDAIVPYTPGHDLGAWRPTPPAFAPALFAEWGRVTPFVLKSAEQFRGKGPLALTSRRYGRDVEEVRMLGSATSAVRTADQTEIALFWVEPSVDGWSRIARIVSADTHLDLWRNARLFALITLAMADAYIAQFDEKFHYNFWRPITAIQQAEIDENPLTVGDPTWTPLRPTPPFPEYSSAHAAVGAAAAEALKRFFGRDDIAFSMASPTAGNAVRAFTGFRQAARENGVSRIYVGFHFRHSVEDGLEMGRRIGRFVVRRTVRPAADRESDDQTSQRLSR